MDAEAVVVSKSALVPTLAAAAALHFTADSKVLVLAPSDGSRLQLVDLKSGRSSVLMRAHKVGSKAAKKAPKKATNKKAAPADDNKDAVEEEEEPSQVARRVMKLAVSPDGQWAATACVALGGGGGTVEVYNLEAQRSHAVLALPLDAAAGHTPRPTALAFSPAGGQLVVATASNRLHVFDVEEAAACEVYGRWDEQLPRRFLEMPGHISGISFEPTAGVARCVVHTPAAFAHLDLAKPPADHPVEGAGEEAAPRKRRRGPQAPAPVPQSSAAMTPGNSKHALHEDPASRRDTNFKVISFDDACLGMMYTSPDSALLVECPWADVLAKFPPPLIRHRYGM
jgi:U3 small nucleolar RNA-associated protein 4